MLRLFTLAAAMLLSLVASAGHRQSDSILVALDRMLADTAVFHNKKLSTIAEIRRDMTHAQSPQALYDCYMRLYREYEAYDNRQAIESLAHCLELAEKMGDKEKIERALILRSHRMALGTFYAEALEYLDRLDESSISPENQEIYHHAMANIFQQLCDYTPDDRLRQEFHNTALHHSQRLFEVTSPNSRYSFQRKLPIFLASGDLKKAHQTLLEWGEVVTDMSHEYAVYAYYMSRYYEEKHDADQRLYWLVKSAMADLRNVVMDQASLWTLADILSDEGDLERSHRYILYSWRCTNQFGTVYRRWQVAPVITKIDKHYQDEISRVNRMLRLGLVAISLLLCLLLLSLFVTYKRNKQLSTERLHSKELNDQLADMNARLSEVNNQLSESNRVKDEYIARFLSLCSHYVDKLDNYRLKVRRRLKAGQLKELARMVESSQTKAEETREFFAYFDAAFLKLFPTFVDEFNALLRPEHRQQLQHGIEMTNDMRMAALIRLGIDDSARISDFLRFSPNTVYNYRARLKSKALGNRDELEAAFKLIGL